MADPIKLQAWYASRQGLDGSLAGAAPAAVLARSGWARSVGGVGPYLTLFSRAGISREAADRAVADLEIHELPAARNCTYVLPAEDFALGLTVGRPFWGGEWKVAEKLGVTEKELDRLCQSVMDALGREALDPEGIRERCGKAVRNLGPDGKKKGLTTTLPLALGKLQAAGEIRRVPTTGRLDQQRYKYAAWRPNPLAKYRRSVEEAQVDLARRYFTWIGPATPAEFQWFSGLGVKAAKAAIEPLGLIPLEDGAAHVLFPADREGYARFKPARDPHYTLVSSIDAISLLRRDLPTLLDPADRSRQFFGEKGALPGNALVDLPNHAIIDRGRLVGIWEYDMDAAEIVWVPFIKRNADLVTAVARTEAFVREQLGDARSFSLDSPKGRVPKITALRRAARSA